MQKAYDLDKHNKTPQSRCKEIALLCVDEMINVLFGMTTKEKKNLKKHLIYQMNILYHFGRSKTRNKKL
jgi:hypothetical protein